MLRFFHTGDWHLGQLFHQYSRQYEHEQFLSWLLVQLEQYQPHALLIAGDIFDVINPSSLAQKQLYQFLADAQQRVPHLQTLMIAGNHDSGYRIEQVSPLLGKYHAQAIGVVQHRFDADGQQQFDDEHFIYPIYDSPLSENKQVLAWCILIPFLRASEITGRVSESSDVMHATQQLYERLIAQVEQRKTPEQAIILMTHAHVQGGVESQQSERCIIIGHQEALSVDLFSKQLDYVALGHLHKPQRVKYEHIRYSGSPLPLSFSEVNYPHQVMMVEIDAQHQCHYQPLFIPRAVDLISIRCDLTEIFDKIAQLEQGAIAVLEQRPFLEIEYRSDVPAPPDLRTQIEQALPPQRYRLVRLSRQVKNKSQDTSAPHITEMVNVLAPNPLSLFERAWQQTGHSPEQFDEQLRQDFISLVDDAERVLMEKQHTI